MLPSRSVAAVAGVLAGLIGLTACGSDSNKAPTAAATSPSSACPSGSLSGTGSTFQLNIEKQWIKDYGNQCPSATVSYTGTGSGAGIAQFAAGTVDFAGSDSLMKANEQAKADARCGSGHQAVHVPVTAGAVVFAYNLPGVTALQLSAPTLAGLFQGTIAYWDAAAVKADNPSLTLPHLQVQSVHRSDSSGTTDITSHFLVADSGGAWTLGAGKDLAWPSGQAAKGSDGVTNVVKSTPGGVTYTELSFAKANSLSYARVKNASGDYVAADGTSLAAALAAATVDTSKGDLRVKINFAATGSGVYPVSAVTYVIICHGGDKQAALLKGYLGYATGAGQQSADALGYAPLPASIASQVTSLLATLS